MLCLNSIQNLISSLPLICLCNSMKYNEISRGPSWNIMKYLSPALVLGPWSTRFLEAVGIAENHENRWIPWKSMGTHGIPWKSMEFRGNPWKSVEFLGNPWNLVNALWFSSILTYFWWFYIFIFFVIVCAFWSGRRPFCGGDRGGGSPPGRQLISQRVGGIVTPENRGSKSSVWI